jgi:V/A-type H+-transporting ATPase subunit I
MGTPGREEADPSLVLAVLAPLLFGFMFGDIGQGAVLIALGLALRARYKALALLVPGGLASVAFGVLFGSVFGREDVIDALWLRPFDAPITVLAAALALGVAVIITGLAIDAIGHLSSGLAGRWLRRRAGFALLYVGAVLAVWRPAAGGVLALSGLTACLVGAMADKAAGQRLAALGEAAAEVAETALQLGVNTVSFVRVGAFALAHCGLSVAIVGLAEATPSRVIAALILILGNVFVLALEALVVGIQTTRLVLFEFFIRFLRGTGRAFEPLPDAPLSSVPGQGGHS